MTVILKRHDTSPAERSRAARRAHPARSLAAVLIATTAVAAGQPGAAGAETASGLDFAEVCVKRVQGQVRVLADPGRTTCDLSETSAAWSVGGEVTDVLPSGPLRADRIGPKLQVAIDLDRLPTAGRALTDGADSISEPAVGGELFRMPLPPGAWHVVATLDYALHWAFSGEERRGCWLSAGDDRDRHWLHQDARERRWMVTESMTFQVVHRFTQGGDAVLSCDSPFYGSIEQLRVVAYEAASISNQPATFVSD